MITQDAATRNQGFGSSLQLASGFSVRAVKVCVLAVLISATILQRFGINLGAYSFSLTICSVYLLIALSLFCSQIEIALDRFLIFVACACVIGVSLLINSNFDSFSLSTTSSLALVVLIYLPLVLVLKPKNAEAVDLGWALRALSNILLICAVAGILQFYMQFVFRPDWLFDFTKYLPSGIRGPSGFNTIIPVGSVYKSNGFFFREPSSASFAMAFGVLLEIHLFRRISRVLIFGLALALTYSGTGLLALLVGLILPLSSKTLLRALVLALTCTLCIWLLGDVLNLSFTVGRIDEFNSERSSAYIRYIAPFRLASEQMFLQPWSFWLGNGSGTISRIAQSSFEFHDPTWAKLLVEYGVLGLTCFVLLMLACLLRSSLPFALSAVLFVSWLIMGGHLLSPENVHFAFVMSGLFGHLNERRYRDASRDVDAKIERWSFI